MYRACKIVIIFSLLASVLAATSWADDPRGEKFYSDGVQAFYRGNYSRAIQAFDLATGYGSVDPRVYYFRGIAKCRQGRTDEARFDFEYGAQLEASQGRVDIGQSLQRVQGHDRLMLEQYRRQAQQMARLARPAATGVTAPPPATTRVEPPIPRKPVSEIPQRLRDLPNDPQDPFADEAPGLLGRGDLEQPAAAAPKPAAPQQAEVTDDAGQSELGADDDPFAGPSTPAAADQTPPAQESDDPFAGPSTPAAAPPPPAAEDQTPPAQENEDPFADDAAAAPAAGPAPRSPSAAKGGGPLGAVFRAMTRSATDNPALKQGQSLLQNARGAMPGGPPAPGERVVVPSEPTDQDPFFEGDPAEDAAPAAKAQGTPLPEEDPFADEPGAAPAATGAAPAPPAPADELDPAAADDPFADENP